MAVVVALVEELVLILVRTPARVHVRDVVVADALV